MRSSGRAARRMASTSPVRTDRDAQLVICFTPERGPEGAAGLLLLARRLPFLGSERVRLLVFPGALGVLRAELSAASGRGGVAEDAYALLLAGRAPLAPARGTGAAHVVARCARPCRRRSRWRRWWRWWRPSRWRPLGRRRPLSPARRRRCRARCCRRRPIARRPRAAAGPGSTRRPAAAPVLDPAPLPSDHPCLWSCRHATPAGQGRS